jgi:hypothetical protein
MNKGSSIESLGTQMKLPKFNFDLSGSEIGRDDCFCALAHPRSAACAVCQPLAAPKGTLGSGPTRINGEFTTYLMRPAAAIALVPGLF